MCIYLCLCVPQSACRTYKTTPHYADWTWITSEEGHWSYFKLEPDTKNYNKIWTCIFIILRRGLPYYLLWLMCLSFYLCFRHLSVPVWDAVVEPAWLWYSFPEVQNRKETESGLVRIGLLASCWYFEGDAPSVRSLEKLQLATRALLLQMKGAVTYSVSSATYNCS